VAALSRQAILTVVQTFPRRPLVARFAVTSSALAVAALVACGGKIASSAGDGGAAGSNVSEPAADPPVSGFDAAPPPPRFDAAPPSCPADLPESGTSCADHRFAECQYEVRLDGGAACQVTCTCVVIPEEEWWRCTPC
jgi:hypothetical protein